MEDAMSNEKVNECLDDPELFEMMQNQGYWVGRTRSDLLMERCALNAKPLGMCPRDWGEPTPGEELSHTEEMAKRWGLTYVLREPTDAEAWVLFTNRPGVTLRTLLWEREEDYDYNASVHQNGLDDDVLARVIDMYLHPPYDSFEGLEGLEKTIVLGHPFGLVRRAVVSEVEEMSNCEG